MSKIITADNFIVPSGSSSSFLKGDGSLDNSVYALNSALHNPVTIGTANGLSLSTQVLSLQLATTSLNGALSSTDWNTFNGKQNALGYTPANQTITINTTSPLAGGGDLSANRTLTISQSNTSTNGYLSSTDWNTFNGKQNAINGTGFVKSVGTVISYDNSTYALDSNTVHINGTETITGAKTFSNLTNINLTSSSPAISISNSGDGDGLNASSTSGIGITTVINSSNVNRVAFQAQNISIGGIAQFLNNSGLAVLKVNRTDITVAGAIIKSGGTSSQFLKADGSVDSKVYITGYSETQTLQNVTDLGNTTTQNITANAFIKIGGSSSHFLKGDGSSDTTSYYPSSNPSGFSSTVGTVTLVNALTLGTAGTDLSSSVANSTTTPTITLNVPTANASNRGALSSTDWTTFNNKQPQLNGTGFVKAVGTVISYDNSTYLTAEVDTLQSVTTRGSATTTNIQAKAFIKSGGTSAQFLKADGSIDSSTYLTSETDQLNTVLSRGNTTNIDINSTGLIRGIQFIKSGGTSSQFLKADGSSDSTVYVNSSITISTTAPLTGGGDLSTNRTFAIPLATNSVDGYLSASDRTNFNTAFSERRQWDGGSTNLVASTGRASLGMTNIGSGLVTFAGAGQPRVPIADNTNNTSWLDYATFISSAGIQPVLTNPTTGTGTANKLTKWSSTSALTNSLIYDDGTNIGVNTTSPNFTSAGRQVVDINGSSQAMIVLSTAGTGKGYFYHNGTDSILSNSTSSGYLAFAAGSATERVRITSTGATLFGTTIDNGTDKVQVAGSITSTNFRAVNSNGFTANDTLGSVDLTNNSASMFFHTNSNGGASYITFNRFNGSFNSYMNVGQDTTGSFSIGIGNSGARPFKVTTGGIGTFSGNVISTGFQTPAGTSSQFLKADGSVDSTSYLQGLNSVLGINNATNLDLNSTGLIRAVQFIKSGGTSSQYLMADGSSSTGSTRPYKTYVALLSQTGGPPFNAPTAIVLENTLNDTITWSRNGSNIGEYVGTLGGGDTFTVDKTTIVVGSAPYGGGVYPTLVTSFRTGNSTVSIRTLQTNSTGTIVDGGLSKTTIEIRVYP